MKIGANGSHAGKSVEQENKNVKNMKNARQIRSMMEVRCYVMEDAKKFHPTRRTLILIKNVLLFNVLVLCPDHINLTLHPFLLIFFARFIVHYYYVCDKKFRTKTCLTWKLCRRETKTSFSKFYFEWSSFDANILEYL